MVKNNNIMYIVLILSTILVSSCKKQDPVDFYHKFENQSWYRFNHLLFEIPVTDSRKSWDIYFFVRHTKEYEFGTLDFNMVMNTPSGEERIKEYHLQMKKSEGGLAGACPGDSCEAVIALKKGISFGKQGKLKIDIESLVPRLNLDGLMGAGIRMVPQTK